MKKVEITTTITKVKYEAFDGTQFEDQEQCRKYENSAECAVMEHYKKYVIKTINEEDFIQGDCDREIDIVKIPDDAALTAVIHMVSFVTKSEQLRTINILKEAYETQSPVLISWNCDHDWCWAINTQSNLINFIKSLSNENE